MEGSANVLKTVENKIEFSVKPAISFNNQSDENTSKKPANTHVAYIYSDMYLKLCDTLPKVPMRASLTNALIRSYGLFEQISLVSPRPARQEELCLFHSADYIECLKLLSAGERVEDLHELSGKAEQFGLTYDCPPFPGAYDYAASVAGASMIAARCLALGKAQVAINWPGGWHHAKRDEASGFCFVNDIVLAILTLRRAFTRVLYIDLDLHHGDGVEDAFCATDKVFTLSFHKVSPGFFPGTGKMSDQGMGRGRYYQLNVPLNDGVRDETYIRVVTTVSDQVRAAFSPLALVVQCGADGLNGDPMASYNLTPAALCRCVKHLQDWGLPLLLLGGGGYHVANTARCWTQLTATVLGRTLPPDIPEHTYFPKYGPDYCLELEAGHRKDLNTPAYIQQLLASATENINKIPKVS